MLRSFPSIICLSEEYVRNKADFWQQEFGYNRSEFISLMRSLPTIIAHSDDGLREKAEFYQGEFCISRSDLIKMIKSMPAIMCYSEDSIVEKHEQILGLNIPSKVVVKNPKLLSAPKNTLKIKYMILRQAGSRKDILSSSGWSITSHNKTYARMAFIKQELGQKPRLAYLTTSEKKFMSTYGVSAEDLMDRYKLTPSIICELESKLDLDEIKSLTDEEIAFAMDEYGAACN